MAYEKYNDDWVNLPATDTPISAEALEHIEQGVADATDAAESAASTATWGQVANRPSTFPPAPHDHDAEDITVDVEGITATDVAGALAELLALIPTGDE